MKLLDAVDFLTDLKTTGRITEFALDHFESKPVLPFIAYFAMDSVPFAADNVAWFDRPTICFEFYSARIDFAAMQAIEDGLTDAGYYYQKLRPAWEPDQRYYMTVYYIT